MSLEPCRKMRFQRNSYGRTESEALLFKIVAIDVILNQLNLKNDAEPKEINLSSSEKIKNLHFNRRPLRSSPP